MNIILIGYRCCGKTSVGKIVAQRLDRKFIDTDDLIVKKADCTVNEMVSGHGWQYFRDIETEVIKEVSAMEDLVIATGGGVVINDANIIRLKKDGFIVWLYADIDIIKKRLDMDAASKEGRPSLTGDDPSDEIKKVLEQRKSLYRKAGDMAVDTSQLEINAVADLIIRKFDNITD